MTALEQLAERMRRAREVLPAEWLTLVEAALSESASVWLPERAFQALTGSSAEWCRRQFWRAFPLLRQLNSSRCSRISSDGLRSIVSRTRRHSPGANSIRDRCLSAR